MRRLIWMGFFLFTLAGSAFIGYDLIIQNSPQLRERPASSSSQRGVNYVDAQVRLEHSQQEDRVEISLYVDNQTNAEIPGPLVVNGFYEVAGEIDPEPFLIKAIAPEGIDPGAEVLVPIETVDLHEIKAQLSQAELKLSGLMVEVRREDNGLIQELARKELLID